jgi:DNA modification methylase
VTSPPYNCGIDYPGYGDQLPWPVYKVKMHRWVKEMERILMPGGRLWLSVAPTVPKIPGEPGGERVALAGGWLSTVMTTTDLHYRDQIVWRQNPDGACAWGSYLMPTAPNIRGRHEVILSFYKPPYKRKPPYEVFRPTAKRKGYKDHDDDLGGPWTDLVTNVWDMRQARNGYPAAFPIELPARCIRLSTWPGELVVDPFAGGGTTGEAATGLKEARRALLVDLP